jgi:protein-disulfide isomerase
MDVARDMISQNHMKDKDLLSVSNSILLGSVIISAAIIYSGGGSIGSVIAQNQGGGDTAPKVVKLEERPEAPKEGSGKVVVEVFSDFQCPFCQSFFNNAYKDIKSKYVDTNKITFVFRHNPLTIHQNAEKAAEAAECANKQGQFWPYHDILFTKSKSDGTGLDTASLKSYARELGLDTSVFNKCLDGGEAAEAVKADLAAGSKASVSGTPTIFVNGERLVGAQPFASFETLIESKLK